MNFWLDSLVDTKVLIISITLCSLFVLELIWPKEAMKNHLREKQTILRRWFKNFGLFGFNILFAPFVIIPITLYADQHALSWRENFSGQWWIILDLLLLDFALYIWHRINHEIPFLWRFHQVHHLDEFLDSSSAVRFHFGEVLLSAIFRMGIIIILGIDLTSVILFEILLMVASIFHHSNISIIPAVERFLGLIMITPALHWVHHHAKRADTDSNYGTVLSIWDRLFRSRSLTQRFASMPIGVEGIREKNFWSLIFCPFWSKKKKKNQ